MAAIGQAPPTVDMTIYFDFNSAKINPTAVPTRIELGEALTTDALRDTRSRLTGVRMQKGSNVYNLKLSQTRVDAIRSFPGVDERRLLLTGDGGETAEKWSGSQYGRKPLGERP
ncbi:MAG: hypothetical protein AB7E81_09045 [Hyphomicrobiaceae bacterium]